MTSSTAYRDRTRTTGSNTTGAPSGRARHLGPGAASTTVPLVAPSTEDQVRALATEVEQLRTAMASRAVIEQAKGVLMVLTGCGDQAAFDLLTHISSHTHRKVRAIAAELTASASGAMPVPADVRAILRDACPPRAMPH